MDVEEIAALGRHEYWHPATLGWDEIDENFRAWWVTRATEVLQGRTDTPKNKFSAVSHSEKWKSFVAEVLKYKQVPDLTNEVAYLEGQLKDCAGEITRLNKVIEDADGDRNGKWHGEYTRVAAESYKRLQERDDALQQLAKARADTAAYGLVTLRAQQAEQTMLDNLTSTQRRCTELIDELRALKRSYAALVPQYGMHNDLP